jgi:hypothetical protein
MNPGDLRRFKDKLAPTPAVHPRDEVTGRSFMVIDIWRYGVERVSFLVDGRIERGWTCDWVIDNSEVAPPPDRGPAPRDDPRCQVPQRAAGMGEDPRGGGARVDDGPAAAAR